MKKILIIFGLGFCALSAVADDIVYSPAFINKIFHCFPATKSYVTDDNMSVNTVFSGWKDGFCRMSLNTTKNNEKPEQYQCNLSRAQVTQFCDAMKKDPYGTGETKELFDKYKKDENICKKAD